MASLLSRAVGRAPVEEERAIGSINDWIAAVNRAAMEMTWAASSTPTLDERSAHFGDSVVFSCMAVRQHVFSAVRFRYQQLRDGKPADLFGHGSLGLLEEPWVGGSTQDLLSRIIQSGDLVGNSYSIKDTPLTRLGGDDSGAEILQLRPDWFQVVTKQRVRSGNRLGEKKVGYLYYEGGPSSGNDPVALGVDEVAHFMPIPDPWRPHVGISWLTPLLREVENDVLMNRHKRNLLENRATPNLIIKHPAGADRNKVLDWAKRLDAESSGTENAGKTLNLYPGADATVVGSTMEQLDFRAVQGAGETRIAAAAGVPPVIVGLSEGLAAATYSNYSQARRRFSDGTMHPLWQNVAGSLAVIMPKFSGARLWYDADNIPFLREDEKDQAEIDQIRAATIASLIAAGYTPESVIAAVESGDFRLLVHTGLYSVQLQRPGADQPAPPAPEGATE
jgi:phage portal protein BeeE